MSWADKQLKKHKLRKQIKEIMDSPEFQKERQKELDKHTAEAMNCFLLISVDYLYRNYHCKRKHRTAAEPRSSVLLRAAVYLFS